MKMFQPMSLEYAQYLYESAKKENERNPSPILKLAMDDIWFFTNGLTKNY